MESMSYWSISIFVLYRNNQLIKITQGITDKYYWLEVIVK